MRAGVPLCGLVGLLLLSSLFFVQEGLGSVDVYLHFRNYINVKGVTTDNRCCDENQHPVFGHVCPDQCDTQFVLCLGSMASHACNGAYLVTDVTYNANNITFDNHIGNRTLNPVVLHLPHWNPVSQ
ncbi:uncharacterized protein LOC125372664 [Haliotis rufescens]|uniref:uncharacterized protein LOC125372664 n=1 Tax=Haliotis rufescens TaxID=6454 RepID=UPI00201F47C0|nr:uncharacterized protein LOC125372664 [Haliotis rufescens]